MDSQHVPSSETVRVRFGEIDGLRALAIVAAIVYEATRIASPAGHWPPPAARAFSAASQGLILFFVLSGFVLAYPAFAALREDGQTYLDVGRYLVKRALRIYPAYLLILGLSIAVPAVAAQYGLPALAQGAPTAGWHEFVANALFAGSGLDNDGFRVLALEARWYLALPLLLLLWVRAPKIFLGGIAAVLLADAFVPFVHRLGAGTLAPFMLGMVAADVRAGRLRFERFAWPVTALAAVLALLAEPVLAQLPGPAGAPGALRVDPLWSVAFFALVVAAGTSGIVERALSLRPLRFLGAASYAIALVMVPVCGFVVRQVLVTFGQTATAVNAAFFAILGGFVVWQAVDRWFEAGTFRTSAARVVGPWLDRVLQLARLDRVLLGAPAPEAHAHLELDASFYAPPPRADASVPVVSTGTGSAGDLAAEILEMKKRLAERSADFFGDSGFGAAPPGPDASFAAGPVPDPFAARAVPDPFAARAVPDPFAARAVPDPFAADRGAGPRRAPEAVPVASAYEPAPPPSGPPPGAPPSRGPIRMRIGALPTKADGHA